MKFTITGKGGISAEEKDTLIGVGAFDLVPSKYGEAGQYFESASIYINDLSHMTTLPDLIGCDLALKPGNILEMVNEYD